MKAQQHVFAVATLEPSRRIGDWLREHDTDPDRPLFRRIIIPASKKKEYREKLQILGVSDWQIYPDLDGLGKSLRRYYKPCTPGGGPV